MMNQLTNTNSPHRNDISPVFNYSLEARKNVASLKLRAVRTYQRTQRRRMPKDNVPGTSGEPAIHSKNDSPRNRHPCQPTRPNHRKSVNSEPTSSSKEGFRVLTLRQTRRDYFKKTFESSARGIRGCVVRRTRITVPDWSPDNTGGQPIGWYSRRQGIVSLSITEAEYIASSGECNSCWNSDARIPRHPDCGRIRKARTICRKRTDSYEGAAI